MTHESASPSPPPLRFSRRRLLRWTLVGTGAALGLRVWLPSSGPRFETPLRHFTSHEARILASVYAVMTCEEDPAALVKAVGRMDAFLANVGQTERLELKAALFLVEHSPLVLRGYFSRFTGLARADQASCIEAWREGGAIRQPLFAGLKELSFLVFYSDPAHWPAIGYSGPLVPDPGPAPALDPRYARLLAPRSGP